MRAIRFGLHDRQHRHDRNQIDLAAATGRERGRPFRRQEAVPRRQLRSGRKAFPQGRRTARRQCGSLARTCRCLRPARPLRLRRSRLRPTGEARRPPAADRQQHGLFAVAARQQEEGENPSPRSQAGTGRRDGGRRQSRAAEEGLTRLAGQRLDRRARADEVAVAGDVVDARDRRPVFGAVLGVAGRKHGLGSRIGMGPFRGCRLGCRVRRVDERIIFARPGSRCDLPRLAGDRDHRFAEAVQLDLRLGFRRLHHQRAGHRP